MHNIYVKSELNFANLREENIHYFDLRSSKAITKNFETMNVSYENRGECINNKELHRSDQNMHLIQIVQLFYSQTRQLKLKLMNVVTGRSVSRVRLNTLLQLD